MSKDFVQMPYREMIEAMMAGKRLEFQNGFFAYYTTEIGHGPFVIKDNDDGIGFLSFSWNAPCRIKDEPVWRPEHEEKVLARGTHRDYWYCCFYSHTKGLYHYGIGGAVAKFVAPFDMEKLGTEDCVPGEWRAGE